MENNKNTFTFSIIPNTVEEFCSLKEMTLDTPFKTTALVLLALLVYEKDAETSIKMLNVLKGPSPLTPFELQFLKERLTGKMYKPRSFFLGAKPENDYMPTYPLTIEVEDNPYSYPEPNYATMWVKSSGADLPRQIALRKKPSTGQWFLREIQCLADIRIPTKDDEWA